MKKYFLGITAVVFALILVLFQSFTILTRHIELRKDPTFSWYPVDGNNKISSTTPSYVGMTKTNVIAVDPCQDQVLPNCLFGTNGTVTLGQDISGQPAGQRIRRTH